MRHEITSDGRTVWVNSAEGCIGRFGQGGIDIHRPISEQATTLGQCLFCTHGPPTREDWNLFVTKMREFFSIIVPATHMPRRLRAS